MDHPATALAAFSFRSLTDVVGTETKMTNGQIQVAKSSLNTRKSSTVNATLTAAIIALAHDLCAVGRTAEGFWIEIQSKINPNHLYVTHYITEPDNRRLEVFGVENGQLMSKELVKEGYAHYSLFVAQIVEMVMNDPQGEAATYFNAIQNDYAQSAVTGPNGKVSTKAADDDIYRLNDLMYLSDADYVLDAAHVEQLTAPKVGVVIEDLTKLFGARAFQYASVPAKKKRNTKSTAVNLEDNETDKYKLPWPDGQELTDEEKYLIPKFDLKEVVLSPHLIRLAEIVKAEHASRKPVNNIILYGEAGAGKTTMAQILAQFLGLPYRRVNFSLNSTEDQLTGVYHPKPEGGFEFEEADFAKTFRRGGVIELMEINYARPAAMGILNSAQDDVALMTINRETVRRHPNCIIIATTNVGYEGTQMMNQALKDRYHLMIQVEKLPTEDLIRIVEQSSGLKDRAVIAKMIDIAGRMQAFQRQNMIPGGEVTMRQIINWARDYKYTQDIIASARATILPGMSLDITVQQDVEDQLLSPKLRSKI